MTASSKAQAEAFAAALAANAAKEYPEVAAETVALLRKQAEPLQAQQDFASLQAEHEFFEVELGARLLGI